MKLLKMSNFIFFHDVFYANCILKSFNSHVLIVVCSFLNLGWSQNGVSGNGLKCGRENLNPFPNKAWFLRGRSTSLFKTLWEKEKLLITSNFSFSPSVFYPFEELSCIFIKFEFVVCKLFQFGRVQNLSFGKWLRGKD